MTVEKYSNEWMLLFTEKLHKDRLITNCINCANFRPEGEVCVLVMIRPPAKVIALGCPAWDGIPF